MLNPHSTPSSEGGVVAVGAIQVLIAKLKAWRRKRGVRLQLTLWYGGALILLFAVLGVVVYWLLSTNLRQDAEGQLSVRATQLQATLNTGEAGTGVGGSAGFGSGASGLNFQDTQVSGELVLIYDGTGKLLESSSPSFHPSAIPAWASSTGGQGTYSTLMLGNEEWLFYSSPLSQGDHTQGTRGTGSFVIGRSLEPLHGMLVQTASAFALVGPLLVLLACVGGYFLAGRALAPVARITRMARQIQAEGLGAGRRIALEGRHDELGELAATFDGMLAQLEDVFARERRFTADAAHELRTPLAVVQAETSLALARPRQPNEYRRVLHMVEGEANLMGRLVTDLLTLARADERSHRLPLRSLNLSTLCCSVVEQMSTQARDEGITLLAAVEEGIYIMGDDVWLTQMARNLVDNGIKYTDSGGSVRLALTGAEDTVAISVQDSGVGIAADHLPYIFDRFYRADKSRNRDIAGAGFGLGLAICRWVAEAHGGTIEVSSQVDQGSCFTVSLPIVASAAIAKVERSNPAALKV